MLSRGGVIGAAGVVSGGGGGTPAFLVTHADLFSVSGVSSLTSGNMAVSGSDKLLMGFIASGDGSPVDPSGIKWGGSGGTGLTKRGSTLGIGPYGKLSLYTLVAPSDQTSTVYYYWPSAQGETAGGAISLTGVNQSTPLGTIATNTGTDVTTQPNATVASAVNDLVVAACWMVNPAGGSMTIASNGGTTRYDVLVGDYEYLIIQSKVATSTSTAMNFTVTTYSGNTSGLSWGVIGVAVKGA